MTTVAVRKAVGYTRVSTVEQAGEKHSSLDTQKARIQAYCHANDLACITTVTDVFSGRRDDRPEYRRIVDMAMRGEVEVIVVQFLDRFGRNPREILQRVWALQERGVEVIATDEDLREELVLLVRAGLAGAESKRISERVRVNMANAFENKHSRGSKAPYGLRRLWRANDDGSLEMVYEYNQDEAAVVKRIWAMVVNENRGYRQIADALNAQGITSPGGTKWSAQTIHNLVNNEAMIGVGTYGRRQTKGLEPIPIKRVEGFFPPILTNDEWEAMHERLRLRRLNPRGRVHVSDYLLTGIARCGYCHGPMVGQSSAYRGVKVQKRHRRYTCAAHARSSSLCPESNGHQAGPLEHAVLSALGEYADPRKVRALLEMSERKAKAGSAKRLAAVERELAKLDDDLRAAVDRMNRGILDEHEFATVNSGRREQRAAMEAERATLVQAAEAERADEQATLAIPKAVGTFLDAVGRLTVQENKARLQTLLKAVHVTREGIGIEFRL